MEMRADQRASLVELVRLAKPLLQQPERECPRKGPGRPPTIPDWVMGALILVAVLKRRKSKSSQYRFLQQHRADLLHYLGCEAFLARSTYFDRYRRAHRLFQVAVRLQGRQALREGVANAKCVAADKSLTCACGWVAWPLWYPIVAMFRDSPACPRRAWTWHPTFSPAEQGHATQPRPGLSDPATRNAARKTSPPASWNRLNRWHPLSPNA